MEALLLPPSVGSVLVEPPALSALLCFVPPVVPLTPVVVVFCEPLVVVVMTVFVLPAGGKGTADPGGATSGAGVAAGVSGMIF